MKNVLIADDTALFREMIKNALSSEEYHIVGEAVTGGEAVEMYKEKKPDLLILDVNMPKMNGIDALIAVKKYDPKARIIMCSDQEYEGMIVLAIKKGAKDFIVKPFSTSDILRAVDKAFDEGQR